MSIYSSLKSSGASSAGTTLSLTAPTSPSDGTLWFDTSDSTLYIRTGNVWLEAVSTAAGAAGVAGASANPLPVGNIEQRPGSPIAGNMRINSETNYVEVYYSTNWINLTYIGLITATSTNATITYVGNYAIHTFNTSGTFTPTNVPIGGTVDYLVVAGGGGSGATNAGNAGGGGAGGYLTASGVTVIATTYIVTVGGAGPVATNGTNSVIGTIVTATGGGAGGRYQASTPLSGGSGGGVGQGGTGSGASGIAGQGYSGGGNAGNAYGGAGGGGAGGAGGDTYGTNNREGGAGGLGLPSSISGSVLYYAGGGGGSSHGTGTAGVPLGGSSVGGNGHYGANATNGATNRGGGGGGGGENFASGTGGSGVVIIRYRYQ